MLDLAVVATTFALILPAELPDKTFIATLVLATRFKHLWVWLGVIAAFAVQVAIAVTAGGLLALLPSRLVLAVHQGHQVLPWIQYSALMARNSWLRRDRRECRCQQKMLASCFLLLESEGFVMDSKFGDASCFGQLLHANGEATGTADVDVTFANARSKLLDMFQR